MEVLLKLPTDVQIILAMTIFFVVVRITDPGGKNAAHNLRSIISEFFSHRRNLPPPDKPDHTDD